jgi:hypothetical protein
MACVLCRSELVALRVTDIAPAPEGPRVTIQSSKTDQKGHGAVVAVPDGRRRWSVARLQDWTIRARITDGYLFRRILKAGDHALAELMAGQAVGWCSVGWQRPASIPRISWRNASLASQVSEEVPRLGTLGAACRHSDIKQVGIGA